MLYLLSPAKALDYDTPIHPAVAARATRPAFVPQAAALIDVMKTKAPAEVAALMDLSPALAALNVARYGSWRKTHTGHNSRPAVLAFDGDVYGGLQARTLDGPALDWAQAHLVILSGLYGVLRPLDRLQPYRLEMGTRLATPDARDLYGYWGDTLAQYLMRRQRGQREPVVVNLASQEYFRAAGRKALEARVIDCVFEDRQADGTHKVISFFAKRARGLMARFAIDQRIDEPQALRDFAAEGYAFAARASSPDRLVFRRNASTAANAR